MSCSVLYVGATWCKTCKTILPQIEDLCKKFQVSLKKKDLDEDCTDEEKETIRKVPTIFLYANDKVTKYDQHQVASVESWLQSTIGLPSSEF